MIESVIICTAYVYLIPYHGFLRCKRFSPAHPLCRFH